MSLADWASLALICLLGASSPGPSLIVILSNTRLHGRNAGLSASIGHGLGVFIYAVLAATTLGLILSHCLMLFKFIQAAGALLLIWIGIRLLMATLAKNPQMPPRRRRYLGLATVSVTGWQSPCSTLKSPLFLPLYSASLFPRNKAFSRIWAWLAWPDLLIAAFIF